MLGGKASSADACCIWERWVSCHETRYFFAYAIASVVCRNLESSMYSCRRRSNSKVLFIFRSALLFSLHQARASVQLCLERASSIRFMPVKRSISTRVFGLHLKLSAQEMETPHTSIFFSFAIFRAVFSLPFRKHQSTSHRSNRVSAHRENSG